MSFKDLVKNDISNVFMNIDEFGETHNIDGEDVTCIVDDDKLKENAIKSGTYKGEKLIYVPLTSLQGRYVQGARIELDGDTFYVSDTAEDMGMITLTLTKNYGY